VGVVSGIAGGLVGLVGWWAGGVEVGVLVGGPRVGVGRFDGCAVRT